MANLGSVFLRPGGGRIVSAGPEGTGEPGSLAA